MAELLGALLLLKARRGTRHGRRREQQVNRERYTGADYRHRCLFSSLSVHLSISLSLSLSLPARDIPVATFLASKFYRGMLTTSNRLYFEILQRRDKEKHEHCFGGWLSSPPSQVYIHSYTYSVLYIYI